MGNSQVNPNPNIVGPDIESMVIEVDRLISSPEMSQSSPDLVHKEVISGIKIEGPLEQINRAIIIPFDKVKDSQSILRIKS